MSEREDHIGRGSPGRKEKEVAGDQIGHLALTVRGLRRERGWTVTETANRAGLHSSYVSRIEREVIGRRRPSLPHMLSLADTFGIDVAELLGYDPFRQPLEAGQHITKRESVSVVESIDGLRTDIGRLTEEVHMLRDAIVQAGIQIPQVEPGVGKTPPHRVTKLNPGSQRGQIM